ncbi:hypothetical protein GCM10023205_33960 [Yinghuangia aomiensis]|uniref:Toxin CptA n=1 Tax=Yinghuangia aomiensis TaxID=676205 RepID=A0ABP9HBQ1_9ACTN
MAAVTVLQLRHWAVVPFAYLAVTGPVWMWGISAGRVALAAALVQLGSAAVEFVRVRSVVAVDAPWLGMRVGRRPERVVALGDVDELIVLRPALWRRWGWVRVEAVVERQRFVLAPSAGEADVREPAARIGLAGPRGAGRRNRVRLVWGRAAAPAGGELG